MEALASALDAQSRQRVSVLGPLRRWRVLEMLELGRQLRHSTSQSASTSTPAHQSSRAPIDEDLSARRATLALTPPSAGFQVSPLAWGGPRANCV